MRIRAVMDLKAGQVVHAVAGQRDRYQPIHTALVQSSKPRDVAQAFIDLRGIRDAYVADLDAIAGKSPDLESIQAIIDTGMRLILDAGVRNARQAELLLNHYQASTNQPLEGLVVPLESADHPSHWPALVKLLGAERAVFSLDLHAGQPLSSAPQLARQTPLAIADLAWTAGFRRLIALDLQSVGAHQGPSTLALCRALSEQHAWSELISGGGVRNASDLEALANAGCHCALVASALHEAEGVRG